MLKISAEGRCRERVWKILKSHNSELTREKFDAAYGHIDYLMKSVAGKEQGL